MTFRKISSATGSHKIILAVTLAAYVVTGAFADEPVQPVAPDTAFGKLEAGNHRFVVRRVTEAKPTAARREATAKAQHPLAIIVGCADSRTPPEIIFDQNIGDLFVIRTAGNLVDDHALGSIEYAAKILGCRLVVVLGHERCGAVEAAVAGGSVPGHIKSLVQDIEPAVKIARPEPGNLLNNSIHENAKLVAKRIRREAKLGKLAGEVKVVTGYYSLDTGKVEWFDAGTDR